MGVTRRWLLRHCHTSLCLRRLKLPPPTPCPPKAQLSLNEEIRYIWHRRVQCDNCLHALKTLLWNIWKFHVILMHFGVFFYIWLPNWKKVVPNLSKMGQINRDFLQPSKGHRSSSVKRRCGSISASSLPLAFSSSSPALPASYSCCHSHFINISDVKFLISPELVALALFLQGHRRNYPKELWHE